MSGLSLDHALRALLLANGMAVEGSVGTDEAGVAEYLGGHGLRVRRLALLHAVVPQEEWQIGCLIARKNGDFLAVLGGGEEAVLLAADGSSHRLIHLHDLEGASEVWIITEPLSSTARVLSYVQRHKSKLIEIGLCGVMINLFALSLPLFSSFVYDKVLGNGITSTLWALVIGLMLIVVVEFSLRAIRILIAERVARQSEAEIDHTIFRNLLDAKSNALPGIGSVLEKYKQIISYRDFLSSSYMLALADMPFILLFIVAILLVAGPLVLVGIVCGVLMVALNALCMLPVYEYERKARRGSEQRLGLMTDVLTGRDAIVGAPLRHRLTQRWRSASMGATHAQSMSRFWRGIAQTVTNSLSFVSYAAVLVGGAYMVEAHTLTSGGLLAASMLTSRMVSNFSSVSTVLVRYHEFRIAINELNKIFPAEITQAPRANHGALRGSVRLDHVTCRLGHDGRAVLEDVSLNIRAGEMVGIAGAPGGGKTTLLRLISGLLTPDDGQVLIDDIPLNHLSHEDMARTVSLKPQDLCLMDGTIEENIRAGRGALSAEARAWVLQFTGLEQSFRENGLNWATPVGARGAYLSGGQRQLVALARAVLPQPPLLLLDEPTTGLDLALEAHFAEQLKSMKGSATVLISTHSRAMLSICDRIIVIGQSRILADGPREKILA